MYNNKLVRAYQMAPSYIPNSLARKPQEVRTSLGAVDREFANVETEGGETVYLPNKEGLPAHFRINGPRHFQGGVPMSIPPDSFVFSDTASMRIKDAELQAEFGMHISKKGYTPAEIAKKYDINKYRKILVDPNSDMLQINTAEQVIGNYEVKLGKLALIQESMKGFPAGIPIVAMPYLAKYQLDPAMFLPTDMNQQPQEPGSMEEMQEQPQARRGGQLRRFDVGGTNPEDPGFYFSPNNITARTQERRTKRAEERAKRAKILNQAFNQVVYSAQPQPVQTADYSTGIFMKMDDAGNPYYVDGNGVRIDQFDKNYYGPNGRPTVNNSRIIERDGKKYQVEVREKKGAIDVSRLKPKSEAVSPGDIYKDEESGKYYVVKAYDTTKPIHVTKSGDTYNGNFEEDKLRAQKLLQTLESAGHAVYHDQPYMVGSKQRNPGWEIRSTARNNMNTADKEFLTDFFSHGTNSGQIGADKDPKFNVSLQTAGNTGFYGYTNPDFYEYRFWKARNPDKTAQDWDALAKTDEGKQQKLKNRANMFYSLGFDTTDPIIKDNINDPDKLYSTDFISGKTKAKTNRIITDADGKAYDQLGFTDAVESYFSPGDFRPGLGSDKKLGLEHADAFTYDKPVEELSTTEEVETPINETPQYTTGKKHAPWWLQDVIRTAGAAQDLLSIKKYMPAKYQYNPYIPEPTFYDPAREIAALQETANIAGQTIQGTNAKSSTFSSRMAGIQGNAAKAIADTLGHYNTQNVGVANEFAYKAAEIMNQSQLVNLESSQKYVDQVNTVNQNYDNAKRQAREQLRSAYSDAVTNRAQAQVLNELYPNYQIDPSSGGMMYFNKGEKLSGQDSSSIPADQLVSWAKSHPEYNMDEAMKIWMAANKNPKAAVTDENAYMNAYMNAFNESLPSNPMSYANYAANTGQQQEQKRGGVTLPFLYNVGY